MAGRCLWYSTASILNSTLSHNQADPGVGTGGGWWVSGTIYLTNTLIANNGPNDCVAGASSATTTLIEDGSCNASYTGDPSLQPLADNGGATWTMALLLGSSAINQGSNALAPATDQRGVARPQSGIVDLGAFEAILHVLTPIAGAGGVITPSIPQTVNTGSSIVFTVTPASGYSTLDVGVDGVSQGAPSVYTFANVTADHVITAAFAINTCFATPDSGTTVFNSYDARAVRDALGAVAPNGTVKVSGYCSGVATQGGTAQTALITKAVTLSGGYTSTDWDDLRSGRQPHDPRRAGGRAGDLCIDGRHPARIHGHQRLPQHGRHCARWGHLCRRRADADRCECAGEYDHGTGGAFRRRCVWPRDGVCGEHNAQQQYRQIGRGGLYATGALSLVGGAVENNQGQDGADWYVNSTLALTGTRVVSNTAWLVVGGRRVCRHHGEPERRGLPGQHQRWRGWWPVCRGRADADRHPVHQQYRPRRRRGERARHRERDGRGVHWQSGDQQIWRTLAAYALTLADTRFVGNSSNGDGGGAFADDGATIERGLFQNNRSGGILGGGGLFVYNKLALTGTQFIGNVAKVGGGMSLRCCTTSRVVNALFAANQADSSRGLDIYAEDVALSLIHTTIASPTFASGSAVYGSNGGSVYLTNTLVASHTIGIDASAITAADWNSLFDNVAMPYSGTVTSVGAFTGTSGFVDPAANDYHLSLGSAAVDAGINAGVAVDFDGQARPQGGGSDVGYDELPAWLITPTGSRRRHPARDAADRERLGYGDLLDHPGHGLPRAGCGRGRRVARRVRSTRLRT